MVYLQVPHLYDTVCTIFALVSAPSSSKVKRPPNVFFVYSGRIEFALDPYLVAMSVFVVLQPVQQLCTCLPDMALSLELL